MRDDGRPFVKKEWYDKCIVYIRNVRDVTRTLLSINELEKKINLKVEDCIFHNAL